MNRALRELRGIGLSTGTLTVAAVVKTKDGKDYKVVFQKGARCKPSVEIEDAVELSEPVSPSQQLVVNDYSRNKNVLIVDAEELVRHFHRTAHGTQSHFPQPKEVGQALSLLSQHGAERAKFIIEFAVSKARDTNFQIQHFGAVLSYASRASADFDRVASPALSRAPSAQSADIRQEPEKHWPRGEARLAVLTPDQYSVRFERAKTELFRQNPFLAQRWREGSTIHEKMIRSRLVQSLDIEVMALAPQTFFPSWYFATENEKVLSQNSAV